MTPPRACRSRFQTPQPGDRGEGSVPAYPGALPGLPRGGRVDYSGFSWPSQGTAGILV